MDIRRVLQSERAQDRLAVVGLLALTLLLTRSFWLDPFSAPAPSVDPDALQQLSFAYSIHDAVSWHGEFPLWNPYFLVGLGALRFEAPGDSGTEILVHAAVGGMWDLNNNGLMLRAEARYRYSPADSPIPGLLEEGEAVLTIGLTIPFGR